MQIGNDGNIENCTNYASVSGFRCVGGICAWSIGNLSNNINYGKISSASASNWEQNYLLIGGITGCGEGRISKCGNYGAINASGVASKGSAVGGIVGQTNENIEIIKSYNLGTINTSTTFGGDEGAGGIVGYILYDNIEDVATINLCYNKGNINGSTVGGIVGWGYYLKIEDCYNAGTLQCTQYAGGILGWSGQNNRANGSVINSYNVGTVSGGTWNRTGGVLGDYNEKPTLTNCYNLNTSSAYAVGDSSSKAWGTLEDTWPDHIVTKTEADMKNLAGTLGSNWSNDINNINDGYPVLKWQLDS